MPGWLWLVVLLSLVIVAGAGALIALRPRQVPPLLARRQLERQRAELEQSFFAAAARSGKPRGLRWTRCDWSEGLELARDRKTGQLLAFVGVTISFEAIAGGDMEGLAAVGNLRNASAVFVFDGVRWAATDRAVFNLNPDEAIRHFETQVEAVS